MIKLTQSFFIFMLGFFLLYISSTTREEVLSIGKIMANIIVLYFMFLQYEISVEE